MADPPIISAPVPPSIAGIAQPVIVAGGESLPPSFPLGTAGSWLPPPQVGFGGNAPFPTPVVPPAPVPPSVPGFPRTWFSTGSATAPPTLFPGYFTTSPPSPPVVFANIFMNGPGNPPSTPTTPVIPPSTALYEGDQPRSLGAAAAPPEPEPPPPPKRSHKGKSHGPRRH
ncbi:MAG TPA: hypothetical protein VHT52_12335 [Stellaceae bacterium]|nr:hypothetical protein [Stellaceae bacterium]